MLNGLAVIKSYLNLFSWSKWPKESRYYISTNLSIAQADMHLKVTKLKAVYLELQYLIFTTWKCISDQHFHGSVLMSEFIRNCKTHKPMIKKKSNLLLVILVDTGL